MQISIFADLLSMTWILLGTAVLGAWTLLNMFSAERQQRAREIELAEGLRRQAQERSETR